MSIEEEEFEIVRRKSTNDFDSGNNGGLAQDNDDQKILESFQFPNQGDPKYGQRFRQYMIISDQKAFLEDVIKEWFDMKKLDDGKIIQSIRKFQYVERLGLQQWWWYSMVVGFTSRPLHFKVCLELVKVAINQAVFHKGVAPLTDDLKKLYKSCFLISNDEGEMTTGNHEILVKILNHFHLYAKPYQRERYKKERELLEKEENERIKKKKKNNNTNNNSHFRRFRNDPSNRREERGLKVNANKSNYKEDGREKERDMVGDDDSYDGSEERKGIRAQRRFEEDGQEFQEKKEYERSVNNNNSHFNGTSKNNSWTRKQATFLPPQSQLQQPHYQQTQTQALMCHIMDSLIKELQVNSQSKTQNTRLSEPKRRSSYSQVNTSRSSEGVNTTNKSTTSKSKRKRDGMTSEAGSNKSMDQTLLSQEKIKEEPLSLSLSSIEPPMERGQIKAFLVNLIIEQNITSYDTLAARVVEKEKLWDIFINDLEIIQHCQNLISTRK